MTCSRQFMLGNMMMFGLVQLVIWLLASSSIFHRRRTDEATIGQVISCTNPNIVIVPSMNRREQVMRWHGGCSIRPGSLGEG